VGFIGHGLEVGFFMATALICAVTLWKNKIIIKSKLAVFFSNLRTNRKNNITGFGGLYTVSYMAIVLLLQKAIASLLYGVSGAFSILFLSPRKLMWVALLISTFAISYPVLKIMERIPEEKILTYAASYDAQRAQSLATRFYNENQLIERALIKPYSGWGQWGRSRVYDSYGKDITLADGSWIIQFGKHGFFGFLAMFGLIFWTVVRAVKGYRYCEDESEQRFMAAHMLLVALIMFDQLPNSSLNPWYWLVIGALAARTNKLIDRAKKK
jgi:cell division protein FtsW (lipid II flippase)